MRGSLRFVAILSTWLLAETSAAWADGGTVRYSARCGDRLITIFTDPTPPRSGLVDISVLIQEASSRRTLLDVPVIVQARRIDRPQDEISAPATTEAATNKLLRAAQLDLTAGRWHVDIIVEGLVGVPPPGFDIDVAESLPSWIRMSPWIGWPLAVIGLFVVRLLSRAQAADSCGNKVTRF